MCKNCEDRKNHLKHVQSEAIDNIVGQVMGGMMAELPIHKQCPYCIMESLMISLMSAYYINMGLRPHELLMATQAMALSAAEATEHALDKIKKGDKKGFNVIRLDEKTSALDQILKNKP